MEIICLVDGSRTELKRRQMPEGIMTAAPIPFKLNLSENEISRKLIRKKEKEKRQQMAEGDTPLTLLVPQTLHFHFLLIS